MCLKDIFLARSASLLATCTVSILRKDFVLKRANETSFVLYSDNQLVMTQTCGHAISQRSTKGFSINVIPPGCSVQVGRVTFESGFSPMISTSHVVSFLSGTVFEFPNDTALDARVSKALSKFESIDYKALVKGGEELQHLPPIQQSSHMWILWVVIAVIVLFAVLALWCVFHFRRRLFAVESSMLRSHTENKEECLEQLLEDARNRSLGVSRRRSFSRLTFSPRRLPVPSAPPGEEVELQRRSGGGYLYPSVPTETMMHLEESQKNKNDNRQLYSDL